MLISQHDLIFFIFSFNRQFIECLQTIKACFTASLLDTAICIINGKLSCWLSHAIGSFLGRSELPIHYFHTPDPRMVGPCLSLPSQLSSSQNKNRQKNKLTHKSLSICNRYIFFTSLYPPCSLICLY